MALTPEKRVEQARRRVLSVAGSGYFQPIADHLGVSVVWVSKFAHGHLREPGAIKFLLLEEWLAANHIPPARAAG